jgi:four helix bundle protein
MPDENPYRQLPIFKKALEIAETTRALVESFPEGKDQYRLREQMMENAQQLAAKIAGAEGAGFYRIRMEHAVLIKLAACELQAQTSLCKMENMTRPDYLELLRADIDSFRRLFVQWVDGFDPLNNLADGWGLFE